MWKMQLACLQNASCKIDPSASFLLYPSLQYGIFPPSPSAQPQKLTLSSQDLGFSLSKMNRALGASLD